MKKVRKIQKHFEFSEYEAKMLHALAVKTGCKECSVVRDLILGCVPVEAPGDRFYDAIDEIRKIGVNINQIAHMANAVGMVDAEYFKKEAEKLEETLFMVKRAALEPQKQKDLKQIVKDMEYMLWETMEDERECNRIRMEIKELLSKSREGGYGDDKDLGDQGGLINKTGS